MAMIFFCIFLSPFVTATTISFTPVGMEKDNIQINNPDGSLFGTYNTSSQNIVLNSSSEAYTILVLPANDNLIQNHPDTWFATLIAKFSQNASVYVVLLFVVVVLGIAISKARR
jgi:hypothetical protein